MNALIAEERKKYHQALLENGVLTVDKHGTPNNADASLGFLRNCRYCGK